MRRFLLTFAVGFTILYLGFGVLLFVAQRSILYVPDTNRYDPAAAGLQDMTVPLFETPDGLEISGWYKPPKAGRPTILYFHGNGGNNLNHSGNARAMIDQGFGLLILEYRGYGGNPGTPTQEGLYNDGRGAIQFLQTQGIPEEDIILFGYSLGTGVAVKMATEINPKGVILQAPYTSIAEVAQDRYWYMPVTFLIKDPFPVKSLISKVTAPTLYQLGTRDTVIPPHFSRALYSIDNGPKTLEVFEGFGHLDLGEPEVVDSVFKFLNSLETQDDPT